jgi:hypothetical protein
MFLVFKFVFVWFVFILIVFYQSNFGRGGVEIAFDVISLVSVSATPFQLFIPLKSQNYRGYALAFISR